MAVKTKFWHVMQPKRLRCTVAIDVCDKSLLQTLAKVLLFDHVPAFYEGKIGIGLVNPKDRHFVKAIGRDQATTKAVDAEYHMLGAEVRGEGTVYQFAVVPKTTQPPIKINLFTKPNSQVVHVSFVDVTAIKRR